MGWTSNNDLYNEAIANGKCLHSSFRKITSSITAFTAGRWYDFSMTTGNPRQNVYPGSMLTATRLWYKSTGNIWHGAPVSPDTKHLRYLSLTSVVSTAVPSVLYLCDYLMFYPMIDMDNDGVQSFDNPITLPRYTDGSGVRAILVVTSDTAVVPHNMNISYTNQNGVSGRTLPITVSCVVSSPASVVAHSGTAINNYGPFLPLADGDSGIRSVESFQLDVASGGGWATLVLVKPLAALFINNTGATVERCYLRDMPSLPRIKDEAFLNFFYFAGAATAASTPITGYHEVIWG